MADRRSAMSAVDILKVTQQGTEPVASTVQMLIGVHIGTTWRILLNRPCAVAMPPYYFDHLLCGMLLVVFCCVM